MTKAAIPYGAYWTTPFARWQGQLAHLHSLRLAAHVGKDVLERKGIAAENFDYGVLGFTVPQQNSFYGLPWLMGELGAPHAGGPSIMQACATGARVLTQACEEIESGRAQCALTVTADRVSNGPHIYYPNPQGPGGTGITEDWVLGNFERDPFAKVNMVTTAENCAAKWEVSTEQQHAVVLRRFEQYQQAVVPNDDGECFQDRYMVKPMAVPDQRFRKTLGNLEGDEGVHPSDAESLARLDPVTHGGTITFGGQTHPADGNAGMIVTTPDRAKTLSADPAIAISLAASAQARTDVAMMPAAPIDAAKRALAAAGVSIKDLKAIKSHNPFAVNDVIFAKEMGANLDEMNNFGCSLIWGHPQGPTGTRSIIELIEELALKGGGYGLFHGCAAGDTAMAVVIKVD
ncbi:MAG: thiolase family protein [Pseudomonadota bacterium]